MMVQVESNPGRLRRARSLCALAVAVMAVGVMAACKKDEPVEEVAAETPADSTETTEMSPYAGGPAMGTDVGTTSSSELMGTDFAPTDYEPGSESPTGALPTGGIGASVPAAPAAAPGPCAAGAEALVAVPGTAFGPLQYGCDITEPQYRTIPIGESRPELCQQECAADARCKAFAYTKPGTYGNTLAACWLKAKVGTFMNHANAVAAVKVGN